MVKFYLTKRSIAMIFASLLMLVLSPPAHAQKRTVSGTVKAVDDTPLPGVSVLEKGTQNGAVTDANGSYSLSVNEGATLVFSFIGMKPLEVLVGNQTDISVTMEDDVTQLSEVIVVGYGTQKKSDITGSIVQVTGEDLKKMPVATVSETLTGRMAGVQVTASEGSPDAEIRIRVRGGTSISQDNSPLYIVDGFPVNSINDISPTDIETISVLKDASSTAIYGARGANGVVLITTKGGTADGRVNVSYNAFTGFKRIAKTMDVLSPEDYVKWQHEYALLEDEPSSYEDYFGLYQDRDLYSGLPANDWQKQIYGRTGKVFSHDLSVRGGIDKFSYSVNYARFQEKAIMINSDFVRDNITLKLNNKPTNKIDLGVSLRYSNTEISGGGANEQNEISSADSRLKHSIGYAPLPIPGISTTDLANTDEQTAGDLVNPIRSTRDNDRTQQRRNFNIGGSFGWKIIDNLQLKIEGGIDSYDNSDYRFYGLTTYFVRNRPTGPNQNLPAVVLTDRKEVRYRNTNTLSYDFKKLINNSDHSVNVLLGQELLTRDSRSITSEVHGLPDFFSSDQAFKLTTMVNSHEDAKQLPPEYFYAPDDKLLSFFGRLNYNYKQRYFLEGVYRADGSSRFRGDNVWGYFPSVSAGWKISEEDFMQSVGWLNELKLRGSIGQAGNNNIPTGQTFQFFESRSTTWINNVISFWAPSATMANPDLKWETTITRNIGLDFGLFQNRLTGTVEVYKNNTKDLLILFPTPGTGYANQYRNMGETENKGLEVALNYAVIDEEKYGLNISGNISFNRNKVVSLGVMDYVRGTSNWASTQIPYDYQVSAGYPIGNIVGYLNDGRYEVSDFEGYDDATGRWILKGGVPDASGLVGFGNNTIAPGMMKLKDISGPDGSPDGIIDSNDMTIIGNALPKHIGGFTLNAYAYGFDLTANFNWSYGNHVYNANKIEFTTATPSTQYRNLYNMMGDGQRWTNLDESTGQLVTDPATLAAMNANTTMWSPYMNRFILSDWAVEDATFLRLNTLTLGYSIPDGLTKRAKIKNLRFYATGYNVFVLTDYTGFDPEVSTRRRTPYTPGVDYSAYPRSRQIVFGVNFNF